MLPSVPRPRAPFTRGEAPWDSTHLAMQTSCGAAGALHSRPLARHHACCGSRPRTWPFGEPHKCRSHPQRSCLQAVSSIQDCGTQAPTASPSMGCGLKPWPRLTHMPGVGALSSRGRGRPGVGPNTRAEAPGLARMSTHAILLANNSRAKNLRMYVNYVQWSEDVIKADPFFGRSRVRFRVPPLGFKHNCT